MQTFVAEFPVDSLRDTNDFLLAINEWILGSRHTSFCKDNLDSIVLDGEWSVKLENEQLESLVALSPSSESAAIRYTKIDGNLEWITTVAFSKQALDSWIGIRTYCESLHPSSKVPSPKKPVVVRTFLNRLGGGYDGEIHVSGHSISLTNSDIELAARCILGRAGCRLPLVYASATFQNQHIVDASRLAIALSGMAHVMIEPNRPFSRRLMDEVASQNVYGGTVGIYWPDGGGRRSFFLGKEYGVFTESSG